MENLISIKETVVLLDPYSLVVSSNKEEVNLSRDLKIREDVYIYFGIPFLLFLQDSGYKIILFSSTASKETMLSELKSMLLLEEVTMGYGSDDKCLRDEFVKKNDEVDMIVSDRSSFIELLRKIQSTNAYNCLQRSISKKRLEMKVRSMLDKGYGIRCLGEIGSSKKVSDDEKMVIRDVISNFMRISELAEICESALRMVKMSQWVKIRIEYTSMWVEIYNGWRIEDLMRSLEENHKLSKFELIYKGKENVRGLIMPKEDPDLVEDYDIYEIVFKSS